MKIYDKNGIEVHNIAVDDSSVRHRAIMTDDSLTLNFSLSESIEIPIYAYCIYEGQRYTLWRHSEFKKQSSCEHEYTLIMHGWREYLKFVKFKDMSAKPYRLKFVLTAKPITFLTALVACLNEKDPASDWTVGDCLDAPAKTISFNHEWCFDVFGRLATEWETEFEFVNKKIHLRKVEKFKDDPLALSYGKGNGFLPGVGRYNEGDKQPVGLLYVQGGERNIDFSTYGSPSLLLPKSAELVYDGKTYSTDEHGMSIVRVGNNNEAEDSFDASDIYPSRQGAVSEVIVVDSDKHFYDIKDASIPESLNYGNCRIAGEKATIKFESGALAGREFDIEQTDNELTGYIHAERRFKIVPQELDGVIMPGGAFVPAVGDKYAVFNISLPDAYVSDNATQSGASWDMFREAVRYFAENENDRFNFTGELDGIWSKNKWLEIGGKILPGGYVLFSDPQFQPDGVPIRITAVKDYVNKPHKPVITLSNAPIAASFSSGLGKLEADEVIIEDSKREVTRLSKRQWRDARETMSMLEQSLLNFSGSINPLTVHTMQLLAGDESLQFRFVTSKTNPAHFNHTVAFDMQNKTLKAVAGILQHMTIGIDTISPRHKASEYRYWDMAYYLSPPLAVADKGYFLYAKCAKAGTTGTFLLSETAIALEGVADYYHLLVGILNSESGGDRSFAPFYGFTEVSPSRITTPMLRSPSGKMYVDLENEVISGRIKFLSGEVEKDLEDYTAGTEQDIIDAQAAANEAERKAQQAITDAETYVGDFNAKFAEQQQQLDGVVDNWFYPYSPTLSNYPANTWTTNEEKDRHIGDTFTNTQPFVDSNSTPHAGKSWRFVKNDTVYSWTQIADSDAVKALLEASKAQATADGKSTTHLLQPTKYSLGDMWVLNADQTVNGTAYKQGEILTATQDSVTYNQAHWLKRVRYTDDSAVNELEIGGRNLAWKSDTLRVGSSSTGISRVMTTDAYLQVTTLAGNGNWHNRWTSSNGVIESSLNEGDDFTISLVIKRVEGVGKPTIYLKYGMGYYTMTGDISEDFSTIHYTGKWKKSNPIDIHLGWGSTVGVFIIKCWKLEKGTKATDWTPAPEDVDASIKEAKDSVTALDTYVDGAFKDGLITQAEAKSIEKYLNSVDESMAQTEGIYDSVKSNTLLIDKSPLTNAFNALDVAKEALKTAINTAIADGKTTITEKNNVDAKFIIFNEKMKLFQIAIGDAEKAIQVEQKRLSDEKVDGLEIGGRNLLRGTSNEWITRTTTNSPYTHNLYKDTILEPNQTYTFSWEAELISGNGLGLVSIGCGTIGYQRDILINGGAIIGKHSATFIPTEAQLSTHKSFAFRWVNNYNVFTFRYRNLKLEKGNKPTDWSPAPEDADQKISNALATANKSAAITDKFATDINGGLVQTVMMQLREAAGEGATQEPPTTAGISGIQTDKDNVLPDNYMPAYWSGGDYQEAINFGIVYKAVEDKRIDNTVVIPNLPMANTVHLHNGVSKIGDLRVEKLGRVVMTDPVTGKTRLEFNMDDLPDIQDLVGAVVDSGNITIGAGATSTSQRLSGTANVTQADGVAHLGEMTITISGSGKTDHFGRSSFIEAKLVLYRGNTMVRSVWSSSVFFLGDNYKLETETRTFSPVNIILSGKGDYHFKLEIERLGDISSANGTSTSFPFSWDASLQGVNKQQYSPNGMMFFYSGHHFYFSETEGLVARGKMNIPGTLLSGKVGPTGGFVNVWGAKKHASRTAVKEAGNGSYLVYHSIGHDDYSVQITPSENRTYRVLNETATSFRVQLYSGSTLSNSGFHFTITGRNY